MRVYYDWRRALLWTAEQMAYAAGPTLGLWGLAYLTDPESITRSVVIAGSGLAVMWLVVLLLIQTGLALKAALQMALWSLTRWVREPRELRQQARPDHAGTRPSLR